MKLIKMIVASLAALASFSAANAAVTIAFNAGFTGGLSSNLANAAGVVSNGLKWGIIIDTTGNGILNGYATPSYDLGSSTALTTLGGTATDDRLILATDLTSDSSQGGALSEGDFITPGGNGGVTGISFAFGNGVAAGRSFWIVWLDPITNSATMAGALTSPQFVIPADGQTVTQDTVFVGVDPIRPANNILFGVPEPTSALLGLLGLAGLIRRRR